MFNYRAPLILSKSWLNRALIVQSYQNKKLNLDQTFTSEAEDVIVLKQALENLNHGKEFHLGQGGTSFRFFCFLVSRKPGLWIVKASPRLLERPQADLKKMLQQLSVDCKIKSDHVLINSNGWKIPERVDCSGQASSQFISALLLNSWDLNDDLQVCIQKPIVSENYLKMTITFLEKCGLHLICDETENELLISIHKAQLPIDMKLKPEVDISSAFSLAAAAVIDGQVEITNWNSESIQPDLVFLDLFKQMGIKFTEEKNLLKIKKQQKWNGLSANLNNSPDLFPVLAVLCSMALGTSELSGAEQLQYKESNRLAKTKELLDRVGIQSELKKDGMVIYGQGPDFIKNKKTNINFNPDLDHRMAMAAGLLKLAGIPLKITHPEVVDKSYPDFWKDLGIQP